MNDDKLRQILQRADRLAGPARPVRVDIDGIRTQANARTVVWRQAGAGIAAAAVVGVCLWIWLPSRTTGPSCVQGPVLSATDTQRIAQLETEVKALRASSERVLALVQEANQQRDRDRRIAELKRELAEITDPMEQITSQVSQAAERMVREADQLWLGQRQRHLAAGRYQRVIDLFPETEWASVARQRLAQIADAKSKGERI